MRIGSFFSYDEMLSPINTNHTNPPHKTSYEGQNHDFKMILFPQSRVLNYWEEIAHNILRNSNSEESFHKISQFGFKDTLKQKKKPQDVSFKINSLHLQSPFKRERSFSKKNEFVMKNNTYEVLKKKSQDTLDINFVPKLIGHEEEEDIEEELKKKHYRSKSSYGNNFGFPTSFQKRVEFLNINFKPSYHKKKLKSLQLPIDLINQTRSSLNFSKKNSPMNIRTQKAMTCRNIQIYFAKKSLTSFDTEKISELLNEVKIDKMEPNQIKTASIRRPEKRIYSLISQNKSNNNNNNEISPVLPTISSLKNIREYQKKGSFSDKKNDLGLTNSTKTNFKTRHIPSLSLGQMLISTKNPSQNKKATCKALTSRDEYKLLGNNTKKYLKSFYTSNLREPILSQGQVYRKSNMISSLWLKKIKESQNIKDYF